MLGSNSRWSLSLLCEFGVSLPLAKSAGNSLPCHDGPVVGGVDAGFHAEVLIFQGPGPNRYLDGERDPSVNYYMYECYSLTQNSV